MLEAPLDLEALGLSPYCLLVNPALTVWHDAVRLVMRLTCLTDIIGTHHKEDSFLITRHNENLQYVIKYTTK